MLFTLAQRGAEAVSIEDYAHLVEERLGLRLRPYQVSVARDVLAELDGGARVVFVSMPTGSGKTLIEVFFGYWGLKSGHRVLVLEPTRVLCEQMLKVWRGVLGDVVGLSYEGICDDIENPSKRVVIATPQTALKCADTTCSFEILIVDEVHHAFGTVLYGDVLARTKPRVLLGFTALVPSYRRAAGIVGMPSDLGTPVFLDYDFKRLTEIGGFSPPLAIADFYDATFDELENKVYDMLFRGVGVNAPARVLRHLELTLARYGARAFCESMHAAIDRGSMGLPPLEFEELCHRQTPSHKARALLRALAKYDLKAVVPILVYTTRKQTAHELAEVMQSMLGLRTEVLTGDVPRRERARRVGRLRAGDLDALVCTRVGEEGLDIPEAGLLVMSDVAKSELRFYQRLGRLLRLASPRRLKYLVLTLTPRTVEYDDLREAVWGLQAAGVDISYLIVNIDELGARKRAEDVVKALVSSSGEAVPYTLLVGGTLPLDPLEAIARAARKPRSDIEWLVHLAFSINTRSGEYRRLLRSLEKAIPSTRVAKELDSAIAAGSVLYIYDPRSLAKLLVAELRALRRACKTSGSVSCKNSMFRLDRKGFLRTLARVFPNSPESLAEVKEWLQEMVVKAEREARESGVPFTITVHPPKYNPVGLCLCVRSTIEVNEEGLRIVLEPQVYYYDIAGPERVKVFSELARLNILAAASLAVRFYTIGDY